MIKLKHILNEDEFSTKFGQVPFGEWNEIRSLLKGNPPFEENTEFERKLVLLLKKWVSGVDIPKVGEELIKQLEIIEEGANKFPELFRPTTPIGTELYRGLSNISSRVETGLNANKESDFEKMSIGGATYWKLKKPISYKARTSVQSWTSEESVAKRFAKNTGILIMTTQDDDFYFNQKFINVLFKGTDERETLHFGSDYNSDVFIVMNNETFYERSQYMD